MRTRTPRIGLGIDPLAAMLALKLSRVDRGKRIAHKLTGVVRLKDSRGTVYERGVNGVIRRVAPVKPWSNKAERKRHLRQRRDARVAAYL